MSSTDYYILLAGLVAAILAGALVSGRAGRFILRLRYRSAICALAVAAAIGAALAPGQPTGVEAFDVVLRVAFALCCTLLATRARRWTWVVAAGLAVIGSYHEPWVVLALFAFGLGAGSLLAERRRTSRSVLGAVIGACVSQVVLRLSWSPVLGVSAVLAALALLVLAVSGARHARRSTSRWLLGASLGLGVLVVAAAVLAGVATLRARSPAEVGLSDAEAGLVAARSAHPSSALADLKASASHLDQAHHNMTPWWAKPGELLPIVSQNERAVADLTLQGADVATAAVALVNASATSSAHVSAGAIDLAKLTALGPSVNTSLTTVRHAQTSLVALGSPWLLSPVSSRLAKLSSKVDLLEADEAELSQAVKVLPDLLGENGPKRYLVMVQDPAELRGGGGLIADRAILTADHGHLSLDDFATVKGIPADTPPLKIDPATDQWAEGEGYHNLAIYPQDDSFSPDFPTDARLFESSETQLGVPDVDGVVSVDPTVLQAILSITGPVAVAGWSVPLSASNVLPILLHDQYVSLQGDARQTFLASATATIFHAFTGHALPGPLTLARAFDAAVASKHLLAYSNDPATEKSLQVIGVGGAMPAVNGDYLEVVTQNAISDKIDWFLRRSYSYQVSYDPATGATTATLKITLTNNAPSSGEPAYVIGDKAVSSLPPGTSNEFLTVYTPLVAVDATEKGRTLPIGSEIVKGRHAYSQLIEIPPKSSTEVTLTLKGTLQGGSSYNLYLADQPVIAPDKVSIEVSPTTGWQAKASTNLKLAGIGARLEGSIDNDQQEINSDQQESVTFSRNTQ